MRRLSLLLVLAAACGEPSAESAGPAATVSASASASGTSSADAAPSLELSERSRTVLSGGGKLNGTVAFAPPFAAFGRRSPQGRHEVWVWRTDRPASPVPIAPPPFLENDDFGTAIATDGERLAVVSTPRECRRANDVAILVYDLQRDPPDLLFVSRPGDLVEERGANLGQAIAMARDRLAVTARVTQDDGGAVAIFRMHRDHLAKEAVLVSPTPPDPRTRFGAAVAFDGDRVVVGAPGSRGLETPGAAYAWRESNGAWRALGALPLPANRAPDGAGASVALYGDVVWVGAPFGSAPDTPRSGKAYVVSLAGPTPSLLQEVLPDRPVTGAGFGASVAVAGPHALVTAPGRGAAGARTSYTLFRSCDGAFTSLGAWDGGPPLESGTVAALSLESVVTGFAGEQASDPDGLRHASWPARVCP